ncbi:hypothetical protein CKAH01_18651 [Colletotrichum kahawae]|uniref:Uncharacterized protein n=1 Tax=Colletotrichum kahawae TaxID=34407 RepID=A0AAD9Y4N2_COLKA|nr:hypothetical protein CKAH01_18651 [Colletotrichum kahawae]
MARREPVKKPWYLSSLDNYSIDDRAATVDRDPEANFVPGVVQYADDEYRAQQLPPNPRGRPKHMTEGKNKRASQRQAAKKANEKTSMLFEEYGKTMDEDEASSEEDSRVMRRGLEKETEEFIATIRPCEPAATYSRTQKPCFISMTRQAQSSCTPYALAQRHDETEVAAPRKRARRGPFQDRNYRTDDLEATLGRETGGKIGIAVPEVGKVEEVIPDVVVAPTTQVAPANEAPSYPAPLSAPGPIQSQTGVVEEQDGKDHTADNPDSSGESRSASVESRISSISLHWAQVEEIIVHERFVNAAYLTVPALRSSIIDDLARELGIIDYADITDHLNEIRYNQHEGARVEAAKALGRLVMDRMIVGMGN